VTTRKEAEALARENEKWFRLMADSAPVLIWASGKDKLCTFVNKPWLEFTGRTFEQEKGNGWAEGVHPEDAPGCFKLYHESFDARRPFSMEYRLRRHDRQYRWLVDNGVPWYDEQNNFLGYIGSCVDVTERKQAESEVQTWRQELAHFSRVSTMGELAGSLAHELNQPLTSILFNTQTAQRFLNNTPLDLGELQEILGDIASEDRRAGEVIVRIRAMLKKGQAQMSPQKLNDIIDEVITMVHSELVVRHVSVATVLASHLPPVHCDRIQIQQVLVNLIVNACDAMNANKPSERGVMIRTERLNARHIQVEVADCGPGFGAEAMSRVFEPFFTTKPNGLGLGLQICRSIVQAHGGELSLGHNNGQGASVRFTLPISPEAS
jgi:PAS domain S-box-containing protein